MSAGSNPDNTPASGGTGMSKSGSQTSHSGSATASYGGGKPNSRTGSAEATTASPTTTSTGSISGGSHGKHRDLVIHFACLLISSQVPP